MPHFHLNVFNDVAAYDEEGIERLNLEGAISDAIAGARDLVAEHIQAGRPVYSSHRVEITDDTGILLHTVRFGDVVDLRV